MIEARVLTGTFLASKLIKGNLITNKVGQLVKYT